RPPYTDDTPGCRECHSVVPSVRDLQPVTRPSLKRALVSSAPDSLGRCAVGPVRARPTAHRPRNASAIRSGLGGQAELAHQAEFIQASPALHDAAVADPPD